MGTISITYLNHLLSIQDTISYIKYICYNLDWWPDEKCDWGNCSWIGNSVNNLNFENNLLLNAAHELNGILRVGGTLSDQVIYKMNTKEDNCTPRFTLKNTTGKFTLTTLRYLATKPCIFQQISIMHGLMDV